MSDVNEIIQAEIRASEENRDAPVSPAAKLSRPNRSRSMVYSVRLTEAETAAIQKLADEEGLPASTMVRSWIVQRLRAADRRPAI